MIALVGPIVVALALWAVGTLAFRLWDDHERGFWVTMDRPPKMIPRRRHPIRWWKSQRRSLSLFIDIGTPDEELVRIHRVRGNRAFVKRK